jgi:hypothetical protein
MGRRDEDTESGDMISITVKNSFENIPEHSRYSEFFLRIVGSISIYVKNNASEWVS